VCEGENDSEVSRSSYLRATLSSALPTGRDATNELRSAASAGQQATAYELTALRLSGGTECIDLPGAGHPTVLSSTTSLYAPAKCFQL